MRRAKVARSKAWLLEEHHLRFLLVYWRGGAYDAEALSKLDLLRAYRTGEVRHFNALGSPALRPHRSRRSSRRGASRDLRISREMEQRVSSGKILSQTVAKPPGVTQEAAYTCRLVRFEPIRLLEMETSEFRTRALELGRGGVGYYPKSNFIHVDVGRARRWQALCLTQHRVHRCRLRSAHRRSRARSP